ncbi:hypothetical protein P3T18_003902 [Paraburkholderia sp. GAS199]|uniref:hypothetical protein n=1 Tax=Paraburkholderia sp. GAS199 TaxID=3035126 RepID=UPI003D225240
MTFSEAPLRPMDPAPATRLGAGQTALHDLPAHTAIVAVEGDLRVEFSDHTLAWLGDSAPVMSHRIDEGCRYVLPQRGVVSIRATPTAGVMFIVQAPAASGGLPRFVSRAAQMLAARFGARFRRRTDTRPRHTV